MSSLYILLLSLLLFFAQNVMSASPAATSDKVPRTIAWTELMPEEDLQLLMNMPRIEHENLSDEELMDDLSGGARNRFQKNQANSSVKNQTDPSPKKSIRHQCAGRPGGQRYRASYAATRNGTT